MNARAQEIAVRVAAGCVFASSRSKRAATVRTATVARDQRDNRVGKHGAGPTWQANDGSKVAGKVKEKAVADAVFWLLRTTQSTGPASALNNLTSIQRVNTAGGVMPITGCAQEKSGTTTRVPCTVDCRFFVSKWRGA